MPGSNGLGEKNEPQTGYEVESKGRERVANGEARNTCVSDAPQDTQKKANTGVVESVAQAVESRVEKEERR